MVKVTARKPRRKKLRCNDCEAKLTDDNRGTHIKSICITCQRRRMRRATLRWRKANPDWQAKERQRKKRKAFEDRLKEIAL